LPVPLEPAKRVLIDRISNDFAYHPATKDTGPRHDTIRQLMKATAEEVVLLTPTGRAQSMAVTCLQEAMFWANSAVACDTRREEA
jgi:hypothetical protein